MTTPQDSPSSPVGPEVVHRTEDPSSTVEKCEICTFEGMTSFCNVCGWLDGDEPEPDYSQNVRSLVKTDPCAACGKPTPTDLLAETVTSTAPDGSVAFTRCWVCPTCLDVMLDD